MKSLDEQTLQRIAAEAFMDVRTVRRYVAGESVTERSKEKIQAAAKRLKVRIK